MQFPEGLEDNPFNVRSNSFGQRKNKSPVALPRILMSGLVKSNLACPPILEAFILDLPSTDKFSSCSMKDATKDCCMKECSGLLAMDETF